jgi:hypothetical protein
MMKLYASVATRFSIAVSFVFLFCCGSVKAQKCFEYGPPVSLTGTLRSLVYAGPPNFESIKRGDSRETAVILNLAKRECTNKSGDDAAENNIGAVQLLITRDAQWTVLRRLKGRRLVVTGILFHAHSGYHRTSVLIDVSDIRAARGR